MKHYITFFCFVIFTLQCCTESEESKNENSQPRWKNLYKEMRIEGFQVFINNKVFEQKEEREILNLLRHDLFIIRQLVSATQYHFFQQVKIWVELDFQQYKAIRYIPSLKWIRRQGYLSAKVKSIEILNVKNYLKFSCEQPYMLLHELAHAYHDQILGYDQCDIMEAYYTVMQKQLYDSVSYAKPLKKNRKVRAYASHDAKEYFAELTETYFGENDYFPFNHDDLQKFDTIGFTLMQKIWGEKKKNLL